MSAELTYFAQFFWTPACMFVLFVLSSLYGSGNQVELQQRFISELRSELLAREVEAVKGVSGLLTRVVALENIVFKECGGNVNNCDTIGPQETLTLLQTGMTFQSPHNGDDPSKHQENINTAAQRDVGEDTQNSATTERKLGGGELLDVGSIDDHTVVSGIGDRKDKANASRPWSSVAVGAFAGEQNQGERAVAVGTHAGRYSQKYMGVAVGEKAGRDNQGQYTVAFGSSAGKTDQGQYAVALGHSAGKFDQGYRTVAVGTNAGNEDQNADAVAVGDAAGKLGQGRLATALGYSAGWDNQATYAVAVGAIAGGNRQQFGAVAIGHAAGGLDQGRKAIAIGYDAGYRKQAAGSIIISTTGDGEATANYGDIIIKTKKASISFLNGKWIFDPPLS